MLEKIFSIHTNTVKDIPMSFRRYVFRDIDWMANHICITGARGVGKTTMLLQYYHEKFADVEKCLYISADNIEVSALGLLTLASHYFALGGEALIIDEIHKYPHWQIELKNIIDTFRNKKIIISGSSSLDLQKGKADLSRRLVYYDLKGLSFREYLELKEGVQFQTLSIEDILHTHVKRAQQITAKIPILKIFKKYLVQGYYPFFLEGEATYLQKISNIIEKVIYEDIATNGNIKQSNLVVLKKILWVIATSVPFTTNIEKMSRELGISKQYVYHYLEYLEKANMINSMRIDARGFTLARKPAKLFIENTNLLHAIAGTLRSEAERGTLRETFFVNQLKGQEKISMSEQGDCVVKSKYIVEIGGKNKDFSQIAGIKNAFVAADDIEIGIGNKIPLYLFGFLY